MKESGVMGLIIGEEQVDLKVTEEQCSNAKKDYTQDFNPLTTKFSPIKCRF